MAVTYDQRIDFANIDSQKGEIVRVDFWRETKVEQVLTSLIFPTRFQMQGQPPFACEGFANLRLGKLSSFDSQTGKFCATLKNVMRIISDFTNGNLINHGGFDPHRRCVG